MQSESFGADGSTEPRLIGKTQPACVRDCAFLCATIQMSASTPASLDTGEGERSHKPNAGLNFISLERRTLWPNKLGTNKLCRA